MSAPVFVERPAFNSLDEGSQFDQPPFSRLAYVAFAAGLFSLCAAFSTILLPAAFMALAVGITVVWKLSRDAELAGRWLAQLGLALSATAIVWSTSARSGVDSYYYAEAGQNAKLFLDTLAAGNKYEALELKQVESNRQLTGTNLAQYYNGLKDQSREEVESFLRDELTKMVTTVGPQADWQFVRGISVVNQQKQSTITVEMTNRAENGKGERIQVLMKRQVGLLTDPGKTNTTALWNVESMKLP